VLFGQSDQEAGWQASGPELADVQEWQFGPACAPVGGRPTWQEGEWERAMGSSHFIFH